MSETTLVTKVTLGTGKTVLLRELQIKHTELAAQAASPKARGDQMLLGMLMQKELLKLLVVAVGQPGQEPQPVKPVQLEDLDSHFSMREYGQLMQVIGELTGGADDMGKAQIEAVNFGSK